MSIIHADSFSGYGLNTTGTYMTEGIYAEVGSGVGPKADPDGVSTGYVLQHGGSGNSTTPWRYALQGGATQKVGQANRVWYSALPANGPKDRFMMWNDVSNNWLAYITCETTGALSFVINTGGSGTSYTTSIPVITAQGWWHVEAYYMPDGAGTATFEVRVEGVTVLSQTGVTAPVNYTAQMSSYRNNISNNSAVYIKDLVLWDGNGTRNNDFLGSVKVKNLAVVSDVSLGGWTLSSGTDGFALLDNVPPVDTDYASADNTPPAAMSYELDDLPLDTSSVKALISRVRAKKADGGDGQLQVSMISSGVAAAGSDRPITAAWIFWRDVQELDPNTAAPWTRTTANAAQLKIDRTL